MVLFTRRAVFNIAICDIAQPSSIVDSLPLPTFHDLGCWPYSSKKCNRKPCGLTSDCSIKIPGSREYHVIFRPFDFLLTA